MGYIYKRKSSVKNLKKKNRTLWKNLKMRRAQMIGHLLRYGGLKKEERAKWEKGVKTWVGVLFSDNEKYGVWDF